MIRIHHDLLKDTSTVYQRPAFALFLYALTTTGSINAEPIYHPSGAQLTFGGTTHRHLMVSDMGNPAHPAISPAGKEKESRYRASLSAGIGIEYDGNDNFFKLLDDLGDNDAIAPGDGGGVDDGGGSDGITLPDINNPELEALINDITKEVIVLASFIAVATTGLNAKAFASADLPLLIHHEKLGGTWSFTANHSITTNLIGLNDPIEFDADAALAQLEAIYTAPITSDRKFSLSEGLTVTVSPDGSTKFQFENNSGIITKAVQITEIGIGYSRQIAQHGQHRTYIGIKPKFYDVGLTNAAIPIADIKDARAIFKALDESGFRYQQGYGLDLGIINSGPQYQLGATLTNLNEPSFDYPQSNLSNFTDVDIINAIRSRETYVMKRQLKLEAGVVTSDGSWGLNLGFDANSIPDPMGDNYQWLSLGGSYASDNWWLPGARLGARKNLSGTELTYLTAGITVFNFVNLDIASTLDTISVNDKTVPRGLIINIGAQLAF